MSEFVESVELGIFIKPCETNTSLYKVKRDLQIYVKNLWVLYEMIENIQYFH